MLWAAILKTLGLSGAFTELCGHKSKAYKKPTLSFYKYFHNNSENQVSDWEDIQQEKSIN